MQVLSVPANLQRQILDLFLFNRVKWGAGCYCKIVGRDLWTQGFTFRIKEI